MAIRITRREFIGALGAGMATWPLGTRAQQQSMRVVGFLHAQSPDGYERMLAAFRRGLQELGYVEGQNIAIEYRWAEGRTDRLPAMEAELVQRQVAVIAAPTTRAALAAKAATTTVPIVFEGGADAVALSLVDSLRRPGLV
jgi:putative ABC transport system substrate-binding protein